MKCFVTGATGFIGSELIEKLINEGYQVKGLIHKNPPKNSNKKVEYVTGDITNINSLKPLMRDIDIVIHCAAHVKDYGSKKLFYNVNVEGTKNLIDISKNINIKRFIFLSHITYDSTKKYRYYTKTKAIAEKILIDEYKKYKFPVVIIRPGNVYGPGATTWVLRPLKSIKKNRIALIDNGNGIFLHTYIDNLLDAVLLSLKTDKSLGEIIDITDGDNNTTWGEYFNLIAKMADKHNIKRNMSKKTAFFIGRIMLFLNKTIRIEPWVTPMAVDVLTNKSKISIEKAVTILGYKPRVDFNQGMQKVEKWLREEGYI